MTRLPRSHHYVARFHLAGFTMSGANDGLLTVRNLKTGETRVSNPNGIAVERDFHLVDIPNVDPMHVERGLAQLEGNWASIIRQIQQTGTLPTKEDLAHLFGFVAFTAVRVPSIRDTINAAVSQVHKLMLIAELSTEHGWDRFKSTVKEMLPTLPIELRQEISKSLREDPDMQQIAAFIMEGNYDISFDRTWQVQTMLHSALTLMPVMCARQWSLWKLDEEARDLICSDRPVCLTWQTAKPAIFPPGFGCTNRLLTLPITRRLALASTFEEIPSEKTLTDSDAEELNERTARLASETYSPAPTT